MTTLLESLKNATQDLKSEYIAMTKVWAASEFERAVVKSKWSVKEWCLFFNIQPQIRNAKLSVNQQFLGFPDGFFNTRNSRTYDTALTNARRIEKKGVEVFVQSEIGKAEHHYNFSLLKLTDRLIKKGIDKTRGEEVIIKKAKVGINLEMIVSIDKIQVRAWTIVASGIVQRPHYRYLVK